MIRATEVLPSGHWDRAAEADTIELPHDGRFQRRIAMRGTKDTVFMLDLAEAMLLSDGDGVKLQDGRVVRVVAAAEPIAEITTIDPRDLVRLAWLLGNHHVPVQALSGSIRIARNPVLEGQIAELGAKVSRIEAPFEPEGAAAAAQAAHAHGHHHHGHDHAHHHDHEHGPNCGCGHDHSHDDGHHGHGHTHKR